MRTVHEKYLFPELLLIELVARVFEAGIVRHQKQGQDPLQIHLILHIIVKNWRYLY